MICTTDRRRSAKYISSLIENVTTSCEKEVFIGSSATVYVVRETREVIPGWRARACFEERKSTILAVIMLPPGACRSRHPQEASNAGYGNMSRPSRSRAIDPKGLAAETRSW